MDTHLTSLDPQAFAFSVPDPTDWDNTKFPLLNPLDSALRCDICKDFYSSPVITNCSHTFCSVCIRRALHAEQICPICRTAEQEYRLRKNSAVQELVDAFLSVRPKLLGAAKDEVSRAAGPPGARSEEDEEGGGEEEDWRLPAKRPRSARTARFMRDDSEIRAPSDGLVSCPSCQKRFKIDTMNSHLDDCLAEDGYKPTSKSSLSIRSYTTRSSKSAPSTPATLPQPLPKINYSFLKDNALRNKLAELGIPYHGARKLLQERHSEWMTIWNANVDANQPRCKNELLADLACWERAHLKPSNQPAKAQWSDDQWKNRHGDQFETLIAEAQAKAKTANKKKEEDTAKEAPPKGVNQGSFLVGGAGGYSEQLKEVNSMPEAQSTTPIPAAPGSLAGVLNSPMTAIGPILGFDIVAPHTSEQSLGQDRTGRDPRPSSSQNGKRKYDEIVGASIAEAVRNGLTGNTFQF